MSSLARDYRDYYKIERIAGIIIAMAPSPGVSHRTISQNIFTILNSYLRGKSCRVFNDNVDVFISEKDRLVPDLMVVCNPGIIKENGVHGAPDLVVEVLSPSTAKRDRGVKRDAYGKIGVKEYWIVDIPNRTIEVYLPVGDKLELDNIYEHMPQSWVDEEIITEEIKAQAVTKFKTSLFDDLVIDLEEIFAEIDF